MDAAASRFRTDSEINAVHRAGGAPVEVSPLLAELVASTLHAARDTDGDVDPTVSAALVDLDLGHDRDRDRDLADLDRDVAALPRSGFSRVTVGSAPTWRAIRLDGRTLTVPAGT